MPKAKRFKANRVEMYPKDQVQGSKSTPLDDSLTGLDWLQNYSIQTSDPHRPSVPECPSSQEQLFHKSLGTDSPSNLGSDSTVGPLFSRYPLVEVDYKTNPKAKPPHSHASLIYKAMQTSGQSKVTLSTIYEWIQENFCYYRHAKPTWQNSIRRTLTLNKCFKKVPRQNGEPGKGGFWQIDPEHSDMFDNGILRRRKLPENHYRTLLGNKLFQGYQGTTSTSSVHGVVRPEQKLMSSTENRETTRSTETPLDYDIVAAACNDIIGGDCSTLKVLESTAAVGVLEPTGEQARWWEGGGGDVMNHHLSYGYMNLCTTTMDGTVNVAELQMPLQDLHQHQDQQHLVHLDESSVKFSEQPWVEVTVVTENVPPTLDQGFGVSEGVFTATCDLPPPTTLTVL
ncbi:forkhead box protein J1-B-like [Gouania willdenowi]|uniref:forkhead box protein J1-B-like n=1 Tax=Gouania willdenowi TaxID=441366 RepID=UPI001055E456|nr:forkhead box protein J1-B-like [Gouania willdenowi]